MTATWNSGLIDTYEVAWVHLVIGNRRWRNDEATISSNAGIARGSAVNSASLCIEKNADQGLLLARGNRQVSKRIGHFVEDYDGRGGSPYPYDCNRH